MKKILAVILTTIMLTSLFGCGSKKESSQSETPSNISNQEVLPNNENSQKTKENSEPIKIGVLKGPTGMGMVGLMEKSEKETSKQEYNFNMLGSPTEIAPLLLQDKVDFIAAPANMAANIYNQILSKNENEKTSEISTVAINTLGMLYVLEKGDSIKEIADLKGKTIISSGKGAAPEIMLNFLLEKNNIDPQSDVNVIYKSEHSECLATLLTNENAIAVLPQPFATSAIMKDKTIRYALDFNKEWSSIDENEKPVTGVLIAKNSFLKEHPEETATFLEEYKESVDFMNSSIDEASTAIEKYGIVPAAIAKEAIPYSSVVMIKGEEMKNTLSSYLKILFDANPKIMGGAMPLDDFYYIP